ncbi:peptidoglycan D,D-transpeptidase FtsI family protein [Siminovitchia sediminis]|uniref:serine-type D-Ala-D-Ala carboxypeptidase n=1 Tax=Siminovitchia sediminis TaxID=1274353 RepID=A0ABW4KCD1_9BACI
MAKKRLLAVALIFFFMLSGLVGRLMQIQLFQTENFSSRHVNLVKESVRQRTHELILDDGRGQFLDRDGQPLSYEEKSVLVLFPFIQSMDWKSEEIASILQVPESILVRQVEHADEPMIAGGKDPILLTDPQADAINQLNIPGVLAVKKKIFPKKRLAGQLIGIYGENEELFKKRYPDQDWRYTTIGLTGLEKTFDDFLQSENETKFVFHVDGNGNPLFGIDVKYAGQSNPFYPLQVKTTIDQTLQKEVEALVDKHGIQKGGALLLDVKTNDLLAAVSRPQMNTKNPYSNEGSKNMMFSQLIPGSVFKTVVAAAAIEEGIVRDQDRYRCDLDIRGNPAERNLGHLNVEDSFSRSCNRTFAELAQELLEKDPMVLENYARKLGLLESAAWEGDIFQLDDFKQFEHDTGRIFAENESRKDKNLIAQTGIGQQEVRLAPISVANMMASIARGGEKMSIRAVSEIQYGDGTVMTSFEPQIIDNGNVSPIAAMELQKLLRKVVTDPEGTGHVLNNLPIQVAGKTGTAETAVIQNDHQLHHKWFAGYFPFEDPQYVLVVVNMDVPIDQGGVNLLYADIVQMIQAQSDAM